MHPTAKRKQPEPGSLPGQESVASAAATADARLETVCRIATGSRAQPGPTPPHGESRPNPGRRAGRLPDRACGTWVDRTESIERAPRQQWSAVCKGSSAGGPKIQLRLLAIPQRRKRAHIVPHWWRPRTNELERATARGQTFVSVVGVESPPHLFRMPTIHRFPTALPELSSRHVANDGFARAVTCHRPVRPGLTSRRE